MSVGFADGAHHWLQLVADANSKAPLPCNVGYELFVVAPQVAVNESNCHTIDAFRLETIELLRHYFGIWST